MWVIPVFIKISVEIPLLMGWNSRSVVELIKGNGSEWHVILLKKLTILVGRAVWYDLSKASFATFACCSDGFDLIEALHQGLVFIQLCSRPSVKQRATLIWAQIINKSIYSLLWFLTLQKMLTHYGWYIRRMDRCCPGMIFLENSNWMISMYWQDSVGEATPPQSINSSVYP